MKRLLAGAAALATAFVLAACSGGGATAGGPNAGGGAVAAAGTGGGTPSTTVTVPTSASASPTPASTPTTSVSKPAPASTSAKPKPKPKPEPAADPGVPCAAAAASPGTAACVDLSAHKAWILQDGKVVYGPVPMLPGRKSNPTPTGTFHVLSKEKMHLSKEFDNAEMPNSVFFYPGDAFHTGSLSVYSHGCIHLSAGASLKFFNTLHVGDVVQVVP
ncbi:L,D-transpeptidase [Amycolatopsis australiensis]|uniref:L,D-transpeptidase catalytic domain n=1 Tax=Amycolatopsis australiensis TaxID=546364 RepID=A0A1K1QDL8_9PSEU|nr:L,D-transpeptidase [Amycolatopsis australiensis]SFW57804.1 L,D-transpeptidase catalytic domain [Amycolatopsis australiensis]